MALAGQGKPSLMGRGGDGRLTLLSKTLNGGRWKRESQSSLSSGALSTELFALSSSQQASAGA